MQTIKISEEKVNEVMDGALDVVNYNYNLTLNVKCLKFIYFQIYTPLIDEVTKIEIRIKSITKLNDKVINVETKTKNELKQDVEEVQDVQETLSKVLA